MIPGLLLRGILAGLLAGLITIAFARIAGEPQVDQAITFEQQEIAQRGEPPQPMMVSRALQSTLGLATGIGVYSVALGGLFALAFALAYGRIGRLGPRVTSAWLALGGFVAIALLPFLKYPANPPAAGNPATIDRRTALYFATILFSLVGIVVCARLSRLLAPHLGTWNAGISAGAILLAYVVVLFIALPQVNEIPPGFPAEVLWNFRIASLGTQAVLWTTLGLAFGALADSYLQANSRPSH
jgi:predicted cobalt transporter CbtA